ncbi:MAG: T9SS type A sorting domain-containing protein [bacterium]|nr:MAG: T9SS type A sorting domain-containing protein [bacterium]
MDKKGMRACLCLLFLGALLLPVSALAQNTTVAFGGGNDTLYVTDQAGNYIYRNTLYDDVIAVDVSGNGRYIVAATRDTLYLFDRVSSGSVVQKWTKAITVSESFCGAWAGKESKSVSISASGAWIAVACSDALRVYTNSGTLHWQSNGQETCVSLSEYGNYIAACDCNFGWVDFYNIRSNMPFWTVNIDAFWVMTSDEGYTVASSRNDMIYLFDNTGLVIWTYANPRWSGGDYIRVDITRNGKSCVAVNDDSSDDNGCNLVYFNHMKDGLSGWAPADGIPQWTYTPTPDEPGNDYYTVAISTDGDYCGAGGALVNTVTVPAAGPPPVQNFPISGAQSVEYVYDGVYGGFVTYVGGVYYFNVNTGMVWADTVIGGDWSLRVIDLEYYMPLDVGLSNFEAHFDGHAMQIAWSTASETNAAGFNILRSTSRGGDRMQINDELIPAKGSTIEGASYAFTDKNVTNSGTYYYWLEDVDLSGSSTVHGPVLVSPGGGNDIPAVFRLDQNYPNPFNPITEISYDLPVDCHVTLEVYNVFGQRVATLVDAHQAAGTKVVQWEARDESGMAVTSGVYFYKLQAGSFSAIRKMVLLR